MLYFTGRRKNWMVTVASPQRQHPAPTRLQPSSAATRLCLVPIPDDLPPTSEFLIHASEFLITAACFTQARPDRSRVGRRRRVNKDEGLN
uniref:CALM1 n=1 Tax=Arundo donax TaxID=35708 RepID=A0A0A9E3N8_ARUDO